MSICTSTSRVALMAALVCGYAACERSPVTGPIDTFANDTEFFAPITFSEMQDNARSSGSLRVEIDLLPGSLVAGGVTIQFTDGDHAEVIDSRITGVSVNGSEGSMTVALGGLIVGFNGETKFLDREGKEMTQDAFVAEVTQARSAAAEPTVRASRAAPTTLQAPDDPTFVAGEIRLNPTDEDESTLILNIGLANLLLNDAPPPDAWIHALNLMMELRVSDGITKIDIEKPEFDKIEFEGVVESVDLVGRSVTLVGGTIVRLVDHTQIRFEEGHDNHLPSLEAVAKAIENERTVVTYGVGVLEREQPRTIVAIKIAFLVRPLPTERFNGRVLRVNLDARTLILNENLVIRVDENTKIRLPDNSADLTHLGSLEAVARALEAGKIVVAAGYGVVESASDAGTQILATVLVLEVELPPLEGFEGVVASVNLDDSTITLTNDVVILITKNTKILTTATDDWRLNSLEAVAAAHREGKTVIVHGRGFVVHENPLTIEAVGIAFHIEPPDLTRFEGTVAFVNVEKSSLTLGSGLEILIDDETRFKWRDHHFAQPDIPILEIVQRVLNAGIPVGVSGAGILEGEAIRAVVLVFHFDFVGEIGFEGQVMGVDVEAKTFKLDNGLTIHVVDNITIDVAGDLTSLAAVAEAIRANTAVHAHGRAVLVVEGELVKAVAAYVKFEM